MGEPLAHIIWLFRRNEGSFYLPTKRLKGISNKRLELSTNGTLVLLDVTEANDGKYGCRALNDYGTVTSDWAILTVKGKVIVLKGCISQYNRLDRWTTVLKG